MRRIALLTLLASVLVIPALPSASAEEAAAEHAYEPPPPPKLKWSFAGPFGNYDRGQLQRGYKVYKEVCSLCHSMSLLSFRNLSETGGPGFTEAQVKQLASEFKVQDTNDQGESVERTARPADRFPPAATKFPNATPPDMSVIAKARTYERGFPLFVVDMFTQYQEQGVDYIAGVLTGYEDKAPPNVHLSAGLQFNKYFPGGAIAMPKPAQLYTNAVAYDDGTPTTPEQYAKDVSAFLMWAAEPHLEQRKRIGFQVMVFLVVLAGLLYFTKKKVWSAVH